MIFLMSYAAVATIAGVGFGWAWFNQKKANALLASANAAFTAAKTAATTAVSDVKKV